MTNTEPALEVVHDGGPAPRGQVIFLHGLMGNRRATWEASPSAGAFWPAWLRDDFPDIAVGTIGYEAAATGWGGEARGLINRAQTIAACLYARGCDERPTVFVGHSLGGLVIKEMLSQSATDSCQQNAWIKTMTRGVVFLATPHAGSKIADWAQVMGWLGRSSAATQDLRTDSAYLEKLARWYARETPGLGIKTITFSETKKTKVKKFFLTVFNALVVSEKSANPGVGDARPTDIEADHIDIAKPTTRESIVYGNTRRFIEEQLTPTKGKQPDVPVPLHGIKSMGGPQPLIDEPSTAEDASSAETESGLNDRLAEIAEKALADYQEEVALKLAQSPAAMDALCEDPVDDKNDPKVRADALAKQLFDMTLKDVQELLDRTHQTLCPRQPRAATVCFDIAKLLLPALYNPEAVAKVREQMGAQGAFIVQLDVRLEMVADLIMAAASGRELRIDPPSRKGRFPDSAYLRLDLPPNIGRGGIDAYIAAWDDYLWQKFGLDDDETHDRVKYVDDELAHLALKARPPEIYYVVLPEDPEHRRQLEHALQRLRSRYRHLMIVSLAPANTGVNAEAALFRHFRDQAYREGGAS